MPVAQTYKFNFKSRRITDESGNEIGRTKKQPSLTVDLPVPSTDEVIIMLQAGGAEAVLLMTQLGDTIYQAARGQFDEIIEQFGKVDATIVPEHEQLDRILTLPGLSKLTIDVKRPNPDDLANEDQKVFARFDAMGARRLYQQYTAERGESIKPDDEVRLMARVASHNGSVQGVGMSAAGDRLLESTVDHPWRDTIRYDPDVELREDVMIARTQGAHGAGN